MNDPEKHISNKEFLIVITTVGVAFSIVVGGLGWGFKNEISTAQKIESAWNYGYRRRAMNVERNIKKTREDIAVIHNQLHHLEENLILQAEIRDLVVMLGSAQNIDLERKLRIMKRLRREASRGEDPR